MTERTRETPRILVVDDTPQNLQLLEAMLRDQGYRVFALPNGEMALKAVLKDQPDLILLDVLMPGLDGYEVCSRLKADPQFADTPVIFLSALSEPLDKVKGFQCGGVDYVTKPFQVEEVLARVETHLKLRRLQRELRAQNARLEETVAQRTRELAQAHARLSILDQAKGEFLQLISHELRTPVHGVLGVAELLLHECPSVGHKPELQAALEQSRGRLLAIIDDALLLTETCAGQGTQPPEEVPLSLLLKAAARQARAMAGSRHVTFGPMPAQAPLVLGERKLLLRALRALLETAVRFSRPGEAVLVSAATDGNRTELTIEARGFAIPNEAVPKFFAVLATGDALCPGGDLGLDPPVAERILSLFGGQVSVENLNPPGVRLRVRLPTAS